MTGVFLSAIIAYVKDLRYSQLFDTYGALLTEVQREMCEQYFLYDLSLSEIAEEKGVSKQSVSDTLKKSRELLDYYEEKLHHYEMNLVFNNAISGAMAKVLCALEDFSEKYPEHEEEIQEIIRIIDDFTGEE